MPRLLQARRDLQQQRGLADAGLSADEHHAAGHDSAAEREVELREAGFPARRFRADYIGKTLRRRGRSLVPTRRPASGDGRWTFDDFLDERVPLAAVVALAGPP